RLRLLAHAGRPRNKQANAPPPSGLPRLSTGAGTRSRRASDRQDRAPPRGLPITFSRRPDAPASRFEAAQEWLDSHLRPRPPAAEPAAATSSPAARPPF